jgi:hypothetical protein
MALPHVDTPIADRSTTPEEELDWNDVESVWTTSIQNLGPPPIGPPVNHDSVSRLTNQFGGLPIVDQPTLYPRLPPPTLQLDEIEEVKEDPRTPSGIQTRDLDTVSTSQTPPGLVHSLSDFMHLHHSPWSTKSRPDTAGSSSPVSTKAEETSHLETGPIEEDIEADPATCSTEYVRGVLAERNESYTSCHLQHGQIWHGGVNRTGKRWRRNQWVIEKTLVMTNEQTLKSSQDGSPS